MFVTAHGRCYTYRSFLILCHFWNTGGCTTKIQFGLQSCPRQRPAVNSWINFYSIALHKSVSHVLTKDVVPGKLSTHSRHIIAISTILLSKLLVLQYVTKVYGRCWEWNIPLCRYGEYWRRMAVWWVQCLVVTHFMNSESHYSLLNLKEKG